MKSRFILLLNILLFMPSLIMAQQAASHEVEMADLMRSNGKIYVVIAVVTIIMTGLIIYLIRLDRIITRIEKKLTEKLPS